MKTDECQIDEADLALARAAQGGLPLVPRPYRVLAGRAGLSEDEAIRRFQAMLDRGVIRRIGAVPNHYAFGYAANGMSVWDVADERVDELGEKTAALEFVTHCYRRPRRPPLWPYNLFVMLHGASREEVEQKEQIIRDVLGSACRGGEVLFSTQILKKTGLRLTGEAHGATASGMRVDERGGPGCSA